MLPVGESRSIVRQTITIRSLRITHWTDAADDIDNHMDDTRRVSYSQKSSMFGREYKRTKYYANIMKRYGKKRREKCKKFNQFQLESIFLSFHHHQFDTKILQKKVKLQNTNVQLNLRKHVIYLVRLWLRPASLEPLKLRNRNRSRSQEKGEMQKEEGDEIETVMYPKHNFITMMITITTENENNMTSHKMVTRVLVHYRAWMAFEMVCWWSDTRHVKKYNETKKREREKKIMSIFDETNNEITTTQKHVSVHKATHLWTVHGSGVSFYGCCCESMFDTSF